MDSMYHKLTITVILNVELLFLLTILNGRALHVPVPVTLGDSD